MIRKDFIDMCKIVIKELSPNKRVPKYSVDYYLENMIHVLKDVTTWKSLKILDKGNKDKPFHYKTISDKFLEWSKKGIFEETFKRLVNKKIIENIKPESKLELFIDSSNINNKNGKELINYGQNKKKKITKVSFICNQQKQILSATFHEGNVYDGNTITKSVEDLQKRIKNDIFLIGDKGYTIKQEQINVLLQKKIKLIVPKKKNMKIKTSENDKKLLKNRYKVENSIQQI